MSKDKILVTGGAGFIGSHLTEALLAKGHEVVCLDDFNDFYDPMIKWENLSGCLGDSNFKLVKGDIRDKELVDSLFEQEHFDKVVHLAARAGVRTSLEHPFLYEDVNVRGTLNLLEATRNSGVSKFIFASSSSVYGVNSKVPFSESDKVDKPISPYASTKLSGELHCFTYHHLYDIPIVCLRFFTVYGPRQRPGMAIHKFTQMIADGVPITVYGDGTSKRDYTYISDIIQGVMSSLDLDCGYEIFNLGNSRTVELMYLIRLIEENLGYKAKIRKLPYQAGDVPITYADISKAKRILGYNPQVPIEKGIENFVRWWEKYRAGVHVLPLVVREQDL